MSPSAKLSQSLKLTLFKTPDEATSEAQSSVFGTARVVEDERGEIERL